MYLGRETWREAAHVDRLRAALVRQKWCRHFGKITYLTYRCGGAEWKRPRFQHGDKW